jgi:hypothetical protein
MAQSDSGLGDVRNLLGFLVAGFAGVLNVLGLKSGEIGVVLRNEPVRVSVIATFLLAGVLAAVFSIFVTAHGHPIPLIVALIFIFLLAAMFSLTVWLVPSPFLGHSAEHYSSIVATVILLGCSAFLLRRFLTQRRQDSVSWAMHERIPDLLNLQCLLLAIAVALTSTAAYGALRLETISQTSTVAEIGDTLQVTGQNDLLAISVSASKLSTSEWLGINVTAVPASWDVTALCLKPQVQSLAATVSVTCAQDPCYYFANALNEQCTELSEDVIPPDASGAVQRTLSIPFSPDSFQHVQVTALTCEPNTDINAPKGTCAPIGSASRLDIAVPPSSAAKVTPGA